MSDLLVPTDYPDLGLARAIGHAAGGNVYFGVRPHNDSLFAGCNDVECDGSTFRSALMGVLNQLASKSRRDAISAKQVVERAERLSEVQSDYSEEASDA